MAQTIAVTLTQAEVRIANWIGEQRYLGNRKAKRRGKHGVSSFATEPDRIGTVGELAVAKALNLWWSGLAKRGEPDVGGCVEVRTVSKPTYRLLVHKNDPDDLPFVLVAPKKQGGRKYVLRGWIMGGEAKREAWWQKLRGDRKHCYAVPHDELRPMSEIGEVLG